MCLARIDRSLRTEERKGWKIFINWEGKLHPATRNRDKILPVGVWLKAGDYSKGKLRRITTGDKRNKYIPYFHIYLRKPKPAPPKHQVLRQVRFRYPTTWGQQDSIWGIPVVVAREMMILE